jgi:hypothetical protein
MVDDHWFEPHRIEQLARQPKPVERLWSRHDGVLGYGQRFVLREGAMEEAEVQRQRLMKDGWDTP